MAGILVLHPGALGDIVLALPAVGLLRDRFPGIPLTLAGNSDYVPAVAFGYAEWTAGLTMMPLHRLYLPEPLPPEDLLFWNSYDRIIAWTGAGDPVFEEQLRRLEPESLIAGWRPAASESRHVSRLFVESLRPWLGDVHDFPPAHIAVTPENQAAADAWLRVLHKPGTGRIVAVHPGAGNLKKRWPQSGYAAIVRTLPDAGCRVIVIEGPAEPGAAADVIRGLPAGQAAVADSLPAGILAGVLARCAAFVGNDSGISHLAAGLGIPSVVLFGPTSPALWGPLGPRVEILRDTHGCLGNIGPETVLARLTRLFAISG